MSLLFFSSLQLLCCGLHREILASKVGLMVVFSKAGVSNYSTLLLSEKRGMLYVGAREVIFALNLSYIAEKIHEVNWTVSEQKQIQCKNKGKSKETECLNYIRILHEFNDEKLYVCGTFAFQPTCDYLTIKDFQLQGQNKEIRGQCPFDPAQRYTSVMVDGELYSGTVNNFLGSEPIITRGQLRTEYLLPWLNEPSFVYSDVIRESENNPDGDDDKIYFFFNEVAVEYEFNGKLKMPRIARVCKGDQGGSRTLQKRWTSFLKAKLICHLPESNFVFNIVHDVFILKTPNWKETIFYGVFTSQWSNLGMSAVCAFNMSSVEDVFSKGKYMQSAAFEHSHVKWVRYSGQVPTPRPGSCMNNEARAQKINSSLHLPDKTLQFVKDHPLMEDPVNPIGNGPKLVKRNVNYKQIVVDRVRALDNSLNDVLFVATDTGLLHKAINYDNEMHIIEEIQLFPNSEPVQTLLLDNKFLYAGSDSGVVQVPVAFCEKYKTCTDCILARDPYCAWNPESNSCIWVRKGDMRNSNLMQNLKGDAVPCIAEDGRLTSAGKFLHTPEFKMEPGGFKELKCHLASRLATVVWKFNNESLNDGLKYRLYRNNLLILQLSKRDSGVYECWTMEDVKGNRHEHLVERYSLSVEPLSEAVTAPPTTSFTQAEGNSATTQASINKGGTASHPVTTQIQTSLPTSTISTLTFSILKSLSTGSSLSNAQGVLEASRAQQSNSILVFFLVVFALLFLVLLSYNCYMKYLPASCLKLRTCVVGDGKKPECDYENVSEGLVKQQAVKINSDHQGGEQMPAGDKGYETESDCGNGKLPNTEKPQELKEIQENHKVQSAEPEKDVDIKFIDDEAQSLC
uniref:Semaphorin 4D n=1 Tax=Callorhinchus milii TaxID=7868 RepID=A0A4W3IE27_CALMI